MKYRAHRETTNLTTYNRREPATASGSWSARGDGSLYYSLFSDSKPLSSPKSGIVFADVIAIHFVWRWAEATWIVPQPSLPLSLSFSFFLPLSLSLTLPPWSLSLTQHHSLYLSATHADFTHASADAVHSSSSSLVSSKQPCI